MGPASEQIQAKLQFSEFPEPAQKRRTFIFMNMYSRVSDVEILTY